MSQDFARRSLESLFSHRPQLLWFCGTKGVVAFDAAKASARFMALAGTADISPTQFFDQSWFRARYRVQGPNAFLSYLQNPRQRLASPSPVFAPRWYSRHYRLPASVNPLLDFLAHGDERNPHPLLDVAYLKSQASDWTDGAVALEYLIDPQRFRLSPHPQFDAGWYLDNNPDVVAAGMNPLDHYLRFGHEEARAPNRLFNIRWYRETFLPRRQRARVEPLTHYVTTGYVRKMTPAPGLVALLNPMVALTEHGPAVCVDSVRNNRSIYAALRRQPDLDPELFANYMSTRVQDHNPLFPENTVLLRKQRVALMMTPKCASARIVYWWLEQKGLLETAQRFSVWSHAFEENYRASREYYRDALTFDPQRYTAYKFVRHPLLRAASGFTQVLRYPDRYGLPPSQTRLSFMAFLERLEATNFMDDIHFRPQLTQLETDGLAQPRILKIEQGLHDHFRSLEAAHALPATAFERNPEIRRQLLAHVQQGRGMVFAGPHEPVPLRVYPDYATLMTPEARRAVRALYHVDFQAYGYTDEFPTRARTPAAETAQGAAESTESSLAEAAE